MFPSILIVDDEHSIVRALTGLLLDEGFDVTSAANGYEALKMIQTESPDLVLLDIWMPGIDGLETLNFPDLQEDTTTFESCLFLRKAGIWSMKP